MPDALEPIRRDPARTVIALDYDGTLVPYAPTPDAARLDDTTAEVLTALVTAYAHVVLLTGRAALDLVEVAGLIDLAGVEVRGHYGAERWTAHTGLVSAPIAASVVGARERLERAMAGAPDGVLIEDKGLSVAVHTRGAADPEGALHDVRRRLQAVAETEGLDLHDGRLFVELRPPGATDKGHALRALVAEWHPAAVLFAGDDVVDIPGFVAARDLGAGVVGVSIAVAHDESPEAVRTAADLVVDSSAALLTLLAGLL